MKIHQIEAPSMVHVPTGSFLMGTSVQQIDWLAQRNDMAKKWKEKKYFSREQPQHTLTVASYYIGKYPVTVGEYRAFVRAGGYHRCRYWTEAGWAWRESVGRAQPELWDDEKWAGDDRLPVVGVSWCEARAYCRWLSEETGGSYRLPTEAEWEKAARGRDGRLYPWGDEFDQAGQHPGKWREPDRAGGPAQSRWGEPVRVCRDGRECIGMDAEPVQAVSV